MNKVQVKLTVLFDGTFWIGIFERIINNKLYVTKYIFGAEPKDIEIYNLILNSYHKIKYSSKVSLINKKQRKINPKRLKRIVKKQITSSIGTKSQQALKQLQEENKTLRKKNSREQKQEQSETKFLLIQKKKAEKHRGR